MPDCKNFLSIMPNTNEKKKIFLPSQLFRVHVCQLVVSSKLGNVVLKYFTFSIILCLEFLRILNMVASTTLKWSHVFIDVHHSKVDSIRSIQYNYEYDSRKFQNHKIGQNKTHTRFLTKSKEPCNIGKVPPCRVEGVHYLVVITGTIMLLAPRMKEPCNIRKVISCRRSSLFSCHKRTMLLPPQRFVPPLLNLMNFVSVSPPLLLLLG